MYCPYKFYKVCCPYLFGYPSTMEGSTYNRNPAPQNYLTVTSSEVVNENNKIKEFLRIPIFQGKVSPQILENINGNIKNDILEFKNQMESAAEENAEKLQKQGKPIIPYQISNSYLVTYNKYPILSLLLIFHEYINGKNSYIRTSYNYNLNSGQSMGLKSLFKPGVNYIDLLNNKIRKTIQLHKEDYFPGALNKFKGIAEDQPFYLEDNNLAIFFGFNEIAPIASEIPVIKIPLAELKDFLLPMI